VDQEEKKLLQENLRLSRETNEIVHKVWGAQKWARFFRILYWVFIIAAVTGAFYYIQPYFQGVLDIYGDASSGVKSVQSGAKTITDFLGGVISPQ